MSMTVIEPNKLVPNFEFRVGEGLYWKKRYVGNFIPITVDKLEENDDGKIKTYIRLFLLFSNGTKSESYILPLAGVKDIDWFSLNELCQTDPDCTKAGRYLASILQYGLTSTPTKPKPLIGRLGFHKINDMLLFYAGEQNIICSHGIGLKSDIVLNPPPNKLAIDPNLSEREACIRMMALVNLSPEIGNFTFTYNLANNMRDAYSEVWKPPRFLLFLEGVSGIKKTTITTLQTQLWDRDKSIVEPSQLKSSFPAARKIISEANTPVVILDDLFPADSNEITRDIEKQFEMLVRFIGNQKSPAIMKGNEVLEKEPRCGVIVMGEYEVSTGSEAARCLIAKVTLPADRVKLQKCSDEPLVVSSFYWFFMTWYISNYDRICELLKDWLLAYRHMNLGVHDRLQETHWNLNSAYKIFLIYCTEKGFTAPENAKNQHNFFLRQLINVIREQDKRVKNNGNSKTENPDYLNIIRSIYKSKHFLLADSRKKFKDTKHDGLIYYDCLCVRREKLMEKIKQIVSKATLDDVVNALLDQDALKKGTKRNVIQISGNVDKDGKNSGIRFYAIKLQKLK